MSRFILAISIGGLLWMPAMAGAQTPTPAAQSAPAPGKSSVKVDMVPSLFVMNARGASLQGQTLTLAGVSPTSIVFADRPVRAAGHLPTEALLDEWTTGDFAKDAPNATVSVLGKDGVSARDVVVELRTPHLEGDRLTFDVRVLEGDLAGADGPAAVFCRHHRHAPDATVICRRGPARGAASLLVWRRDRAVLPTLRIPGLLPAALWPLSLPILTVEQLRGGRLRLDFGYSEGN
jgi:hypothetical protein